MKWAKRKTITNATVLALIDVVKEKEENEREQQYWNTYHCQSKLVLFNGRMFGNYCKNRICATCNAIRKAQLINKYYPVLKTWENVQFVTLTVLSCNERNLDKWVNGMYRAFKLIKGRCNKRYQRGNGPKLIGIKSLECNFNATKRTYNPHFHILVPNREIADLLKKEWIHQWKSDKKLFTNPKAQYIRPVLDLEEHLIEVIKYGSKVFSNQDPNNKRNRKKGDISDLFIYAKALDNVLEAFKGHRLFDRFGFNLPAEVRPLSRTQLVQDFERFTFDPKSNDWLNDRDEVRLSGYSISLELQYLLEECINREAS